MRSGQRRQRTQRGAAAQALATWAVAPLVVPLVALLAGLMLAGCSGGDESASSSDSGGGSAARADVADSTDADGATRAGTPGRAAVQARAVIATGEVSLRGDDLTRIREDLDRLLGRYGGTVAQEQTTRDGEGAPTRSRLVLRVPSPRFDELMAAFDDVATVTSTQREEVDVTTEVIDVDARVRTAEVSLERLRGFLGRAETVTDVIRLESEIAEREAELASLTAQQDHLEDQTSLATVRVVMESDAVAVDPDDPLADAGFLTGLRNGWNALLDVLVVTATVVGALVPFAVVLVLLAGPLAWWLRSRRHHRAAPEPTAPLTRP